MKLVDGEYILSVLDKMSSRDVNKKMMITLINTASYVQKENKGKWIPFIHEAYLDKTIMYGCSECRQSYGRRTRYCPNCGSHMMEEVGI